MTDFGAVYSKNVCVFRGAEKEGYPFLAEPYHVSFIAVAADHKPPVVTINGKMRLPPACAERAKRKIQTMFAVALENGHDALVLSAFGCGM